MDPKTYSRGDLLRMRHSQPWRQGQEYVQRRLREDDEIGDIVRMTPSGALPLIKEEARQTSGESDDFASSKKLSRQLDGTDSEWRYRGRHNSENAEPQPIPAPPGLSAQKDEGFQRFYKAVVSPTHVRVTAGGRIVPNTRGSSPAARWAKEKPPAEESSVSTRNTVVPDQAMVQMTPAYPGYHTPMYPYAVPSMVAPMHTSGASFPMIPWAMGYQMASPYGMYPQAVNHTPGVAAPPQSPSKVDGQHDQPDAEAPGQASVSAPEKTEPPVSSSFSGAWAVQPSASPMFPWPMGASHGYAMAPIINTMPASRPPAQQAAQSEAPKQVQSGAAQQLSSQVGYNGYGGYAGYNGSYTVVPPAMMSAYGLPTSSIRYSEISKRHIETLKGTLRHYENQLLYNKHQIDEKQVENYVEHVRGLVSHFEKQMETQIAYESQHLAKSPTKELTDGSEESKPSEDSSHQKPAEDEGSKSDQVGVEDVSQPVAIRTIRAKPSKTALRLNGSYDSAKSTPAFRTTRVSFNSSDDTSTIGTSQSVPANVALASPFQPRPEPHITQPLSMTTPMTSIDSAATGRQSEDSNYQKFVIHKSRSSSSLSAECELHPNLKPYLIGRLPDGMCLDKATDKDYVYPRDLTPVELRARQVYWSRASGEAQVGLPKFDGRDFYPASPPRDPPSLEMSSSSNNSRASFNNSAIKGPGKGTDPFRSRSMQDLRQPPVPAPVFNERIASQVRIGHYGVASVASTSSRMPLSDSRKGGQGVSSSAATHEQADADDDSGRTPPFRGRSALARNGLRTHGPFWQNTMHRGGSNTNTAPGEVSPMTVQGVLPQYAGHATASLSPRGIPRISGHREISSVSPIQVKQPENRPPGDKLTVRFNPTVRIQPGPTH